MSFIHQNMLALTEVTVNHILLFDNTFTTIFRYVAIFLALAIITPVITLISYDFILYCIRLVNLKGSAKYISEKFFNLKFPKNDLKSNENEDESSDDQDMDDIVEGPITVTCSNQYSS